MKKMIKLFDPVVGIKEELAIRKTLKSHFWASGAGTGSVLKFENKFNQYIGSDCTVALNSGTAALHLALSLFDIRNREVVIPSLSFVSTAHAVIYNGGIPIFVDVDPNTLCIDPDQLRKSITKKTKVILPVHFAGMPCDLDEIIGLCEEFKIHLIEDAAHAVGTLYKDRKIGAHGDAVCFSFHPVKNLAMPTGGAISLNGNNAKKFKKILQSRRWCGIANRKRWTYDVNDLGWNYYMNEFSAAIGIEQLKKLDYLNNKRRKIAQEYSDKINIEAKMPFNKESSYHFYWMQVKNRERFMSKMLANNVETGIHYKPIHRMSFYKQRVNLPNTDKASEHLVSIPIHPNLSGLDIEKIIQLINKLC